MNRRLNRLGLTPPMPTRDDPYAQLTWLCARYVRRYKNSSTRAATESSMQAFIKTLHRSAGTDKRPWDNCGFLLRTHCDPFLLYRAILSWQEKKHAPSTVGGRAAHLLHIFNYAVDEKLIANMTFFIPEIGERQRTTLSREAYEESELNCILKTFQPIVEYANRVVNAYRITGLGVDPTLQPRVQGKSLTKSKPNQGWRDWDNVVWYFENRMNCKAVRGQKLKNEHKSFLRASRQFGGLYGVYRKLGVTPQIDVHLIAPLAVKLCWETGLNSETLLSLKRDCFQEHHPLTGLPFLRYYKARSTGEKDLHLPLLNSEDQSLVPLEYKQSTIIRRTIQLIEKLTVPLLDRADLRDRPYLFLYQPRTPALRDKVVRLNVGGFYQWSKFLRRRIKNANQPGLPDVFNLGRFRPTKITQLVRQGKDIFDIQAIAGHQSSSTTFRYLATHQIAPQAQREVTAALKKIHENKQEFDKNPKPYATEETLNSSNVIYKAILCDCKDVFHPPNNIKKVLGHRKNESCTYFNMCLTCPNALILKRHLPRLIAYKREIETARASSLTTAPNSAHYDKAIAVIEGIFLEFTEADLEWAQQIERGADFHSDPFIYKPVSET